MRRFLKRLFLFGSIPCAIAVLWTAFVVVMDYRSYTGALPLADGETVVVCEDSQTKDALDPSVIEGLRNYSAAATTCDQDAMRLSDVLAANRGRVRFVLLDASPLEIGHDMSRPISQLNASRVHLLLHVYHLRDNRRPFGSVAALWRDVVFTRKFNEFRKSILRRKPWRSSMAGGFDPDSTKGFTNAKYRQAAMEDVAEKAARVNGRPPAAGGLPFFANLEEQVASVRAAGAVPVITTMPLSGHLRRAITPDRLAAFTREVAALAKRLDVVYLDYLGLDLPEDCWHDANHLNRDGAATFSRRFNADFRKRVVVGQPAK